MTAIVENYEGAVRKAVCDGADINDDNDNAYTPLLSAAMNGNTDMVRLILSLDADPNANLNHPDSQTILHLIAESDNAPEVAGILVEAGADISATDEYEKTPLHAAAFCGHVKYAQFLIDCGATVDQKDGLGLTPLVLAARANRVEMTQFLIDAGADVNTTDNKGRSALWRILSFTKEGETVRLLLEHGADPNSHINNKYRPLHRAVNKGNVRAIPFLVQYGADVAAADEDDETILEYYFLPNDEHLVMLKTLHDIGILEDPRLENARQKALMKAVDRKHIESAKILIDAGTDINSAGSEDERTNAVHMAITKASLEMLKMFAEKGIDFSVKDSIGRNVLDAAKDRNKPDIYELLKSYQEKEQLKAQKNRKTNRSEEAPGL